MISNSPSQKNILEKIEDGSITSHSRSYFYTKKIILVIGLILSGSISIFFGSFIIFSLRQNGGWFVPSFGWPGIGPFLYSIPWFFVGTMIIFLVLLNLLLRSYRFAYRRPLLYIITAVGLSFISITAIVAKIHLHEYLLTQAAESPLPLMRPMYITHQGSPRSEAITLGLIIEKIDDGFIILSPENEEFNIRLSERVHLPPNQELSAGKIVVILGKRRGQFIIADGIRILDNENQIFLNRPKPMRRLK